MVSRLPDCLIIDLENGTDEHDCMPVKANTLTEFNEIINRIQMETLAHRKKVNDPNAFLYKYISIDTVDELEELVIRYETAIYNKDVEKNPKDKDGKMRSAVKTITDLPYGAGYGYVREGVKEKFLAVGKFCKYLILISHVKDKMLAGIGEKTGNDVGDTEISLSGKLATIVMSRASAIGYVFRSDTEQTEYNGEKVPKLMISFETVANRSAAGSRSKHLAGKVIPFDWSLIYID